MHGKTLYRTHSYVFKYKSVKLQLGEGLTKDANGNFVCKEDYRSCGKFSLSPLNSKYPMLCIHWNYDCPYKDIKAGTYKLNGYSEHIQLENEDFLCFNRYTEKDAIGVAKSVICSSLLKAAMFGADANWGRVLCAIGYSGCDVDVHKVDVSFASEEGRIDVCKNGAGIDFSEDEAKAVLIRDEIDIIVDLNDGEGKAEAYGCDLTYDYVKINGDYRT